jgi:hypothetical protein
MALPAARDWPATGLFVGAVAWAVGHQANYALVPWLCTHHMRLLFPAIAGLLALVSLAGAGISFLSLRATGPGRPEGIEYRRPRHFMAIIGLSAGLLFALVILVQGSAAFVLQGCER